MRDQELVFEQIYKLERWGKGKGSGTGSDPVYCKDYLAYLANFIDENNVRSVLDVGCGDGQLYANFVWSGVDYTGCDISQVALDLNKVRAPNRDLIKVSGLVETLNLIDKIKPDLILIKDVMQHWTDDEIEIFLDALKDIPGWKYIVTSNNWKFHRDPTKNGQPRVLDRYSWAPIPIDHSAFVDFGFKPIFRYPKGRFKQVMLATRGE